jgi:hypothetical protein
MPVNGMKEIGVRSVATIKYWRPVVTGTDPPAETTHDAGAAGIDIKYPTEPPFTIPIIPPSSDVLLPVML